MKLLRIKKHSVVFLLLFTPAFLMSQTIQKQVQSLSRQQLNKIDPRFHGLIAEQIPSIREPGMKRVSKPTLIQPDGTEIYSAVVYTDDPDALRLAGIQVNSVLPRFVTARFRASDLVILATHEAVKYVDAGETYYPTNDVAAGAVGADLVQDGYVNATNYKGSGVLVCIIDTGIDWKHFDFRDPSDTTDSRILYIWDHTISATGGEGTPQDRDGVNFAGLDYGVEYTETHIEDEIDGSPALFVREQDTNGHGTHVAGTAAGNGAALSTQKYAGMAPEADIIIVKAGNASFPTAELIDALTYAKKISETLGQPMVVNMSLGGHANAHDGTRDLDEAVDNYVAAGRVAVISAGNEGNDNIHITGTVTNGNSVNIQFTVPSYTPNSGTDNDYFGFDLWYNNAGNITATVTSPNSHTYQRSAGQSGTSETDDGAISLYNNTSGDHSNGDRRNYLLVDDNDPSKTPAQGTWTLNVLNNSGSTMTYHGWLFTTSMNASLNGGDSDYTVGSPGTATSAVTVGSYAHRWRWYTDSGSAYYSGVPDYSDDISTFSSIGPRRDGVQKPDITAPGQRVGSSMSQHASTSADYKLPGAKHRVNQGTSMSSPVVAGSAALLLEMNSALTASQIKDLITSTAMTDSYTGTGLPDYTWGYGKLDIFKAMVKAFDSGSDVDREILVYDQWNIDAGVSLGYGVVAAVRFTPTITGKVTGTFMHTSTTWDITDPFQIEIWSDDGSGYPNTQIGSTVRPDYDDFIPFSWNYVNLIDANVSVTAGTDYHVVFYHSTTGKNTSLRMENNPSDSRTSIDVGAGFGPYAYDLRIRAVVSKDEGVLVQAKVFLEGPYNDSTNEMNKDLNSGGYIPTTSPYSEDPRTVPSIPSDVVDWVLLQLRESLSGATVTSRSALLHKDGTIVADDGTTNQITMVAGSGSYYLVVKHRNHVSVMSTNMIPLNGTSSTLYDFTTGTGQYYGGDAKLVDTSPTNKYGMYKGDTDGSGTVDANDRAATWNDRNDTGYNSSDCCLSGTVDANDRAATWNNRNKSTNVPTQ